MITKDELERLKILADAATEGPWEYVETDTYVKDGMEWGGDDVIRQTKEDGIVVLNAFGGEGAGGGWGAIDIEASDAAFIAAAREAVPALIADLERARDLLVMHQSSRDLSEVISGPSWRADLEMEIDAYLHEAGEIP